MGRGFEIDQSALYIYIRGGNGCTELTYQGAYTWEYDRRSLLGELRSCYMYNIQWLQRPAPLSGLEFHQTDLPCRPSGGLPYITYSKVIIGWNGPETPYMRGVRY